jgi:dynein heavy chain
LFFFIRPTANQIKYESFVEDINNLLNSGEVPNLFTKEDIAEICEKIAADAKKARGAETPEGQVRTGWVKR